MRQFYQRARGAGHPDVATAIFEVLNTDQRSVLDDLHEWLASANAPRRTEVSNPNIKSLDLRAPGRAPGKRHPLTLSQ